MRKKSTRLKIAFFSLLLIGFMVIQYSWVMSLYREKLQELNALIVSGIDDAGKKIPLSESRHELTDAAAITTMLRQSLSAKGLGNIRFEFSINSSDHHLTSRDFQQIQMANSSNLIFYYTFPRNNDVLTVVIPFAKKGVWKELVWVIAASVLLTIIIMAIFCFTSILGERGQQLFYDTRTNVINNMMKQLETPLSTVSVAAEALRNDKVMHDSRKINYYQQIITEENKRMNEQVKKFMRDIE